MLVFLVTLEFLGPNKVKKTKITKRTRNTPPTKKTKGARSAFCLRECQPRSN